MPLRRPCLRYGCRRLPERRSMSPDCRTALLSRVQNEMGPIRGERQRKAAFSPGRAASVTSHRAVTGIC
jgi:hypothetical protein